MFSLKTPYLSYLVSFSLLASGIALNNVQMAYAAVLALAVGVAHEYVDKLKSSKDITFSIPEDFKRKVDDLGQRVATIEFGIKSRGF